MELLKLPEERALSKHLTAKYLPPAKEPNQPIPAAYGSYSSWAGSANSYAWSFSKQQPSAAFASGTKKSTTPDVANASSSVGDPGAYKPYENSDLAATAAFTHNMKVQAEQRQTAASAGAPVTERGLATTSTSLAALSPDIELFPLNRHELRTVKTASSIAMPQSWAEGAKAAGQAAAEFFAILRPEADTEAPSQACKTLGFSAPSFDGMPVDALAIKADIEARSKEDRLAKWEARHGRPGKPQPPPPPPGAGKRAANRLFEQAKEAQVRENPMILLAWSEKKAGGGGGDGAAAAAAATADGGGGASSQGTGRAAAADLDGLAAASTSAGTAWGPGGLAGLTGQQAHDVWLGLLDPDSLQPLARQHQPLPTPPLTPPAPPAPPTPPTPPTPPSQSARQPGSRASTQRDAATKRSGGQAKAAHARRPHPTASGASPPAPAPPPAAPAGGKARASSARAHKPAASASGGARPAASARPGAPKKLVRRHPSTRNYYAILHIAPDASDAEIKAAYHALAKVWHPDKHASAGAAALEKADRTFKLVARAYQVLSDAKTRNRFDRGENVDAK
jgi:hypothetical protein